MPETWLYECHVLTTKLFTMKKLFFVQIALFIAVLFVGCSAIVGVFFLISLINWEFGMFLLSLVLVCAPFMYIVNRLTKATND